VRNLTTLLQNGIQALEGEFAEVVLLYGPTGEVGVSVGALSMNADLWQKGQRGLMDDVGGSGGSAVQSECGRR